MTKDELKAKVSAELKAQGINASDAQIEEAITKTLSKQELNENALDNVAGGFNPVALLPYIPTIIDAAKKIFGGGGDKKDGGGSSGPSYNNTNDGGKQMNNQGKGNSNGNSGTMNW